MIQALANTANFQEQPIWFVCALGIATVFIGLVCLILLCKILGVLNGKTEKAADKTSAPVAAPVAAVQQPIENRQEIIAAVSAVIAEELGTDVSALRILSFKKI